MSGIHRSYVVTKQYLEDVQRELHERGLELRLIKVENTVGGLSRAVFVNGGELDGKNLGELMDRYNIGRITLRSK